MIVIMMMMMVELAAGQEAKAVWLDGRMRSVRTGQRVRIRFIGGLFAYLVGV